MISLTLTGGRLLVIPILEMKKVRLRLSERLVQRHTLVHR